jgi:hypothetical protein
MPRKLLRDGCSFSTSYRRATCTVLSLLRRRHAATCLGFCFIYGAGTFTKKGRRLDAEIKRAQNADFHIPPMAMIVECIMIRMQSERMRSYNMRTTGGNRERSLEVQWGTKEIH